MLRAAEQGRHSQALGGKTGKRSDDNGGFDDHSKRILDSLSSGVILLDRSLLIVGLNPAAENILGISARRAAGASLLRLADDEPELRDILSRVIETGDHYANEIRLGRTEVNAKERVVDCHVSPVDFGEAALLVEMTDVTRRARISRENALLIQHGAGRQMIRQLAHEIKNPLGGIRGAAQLLERQLAEDELKEYTDVVISETDRLAALVDTLLGPGGPANKQPLNVHELLEYVVRIIEAEEQRQVSFRRDYDPGLPLIDLDRDQMVQAFLNLIRNAVTALEGHGTITLRSRAATNFTIGDTRHRVIASIEIEDDGPGIPFDLQDSVFYPLITNRPDGTGLGLPAAQELLSRHGGLIEFESRPGRTVFFVRIPLQAVEKS
ncbi:MAG: nitrogen regulation protein NR(II) [Gammaproteobacteria bacterium]|nr:nitrogen regulation protein NR(II) [Gammaproteobacteria bacterium]MDH3428847.1 nitrogen regulation protein NR(II) [Gammaproteobacteria bacterium]MDH3482189.1 nitrogen regulation protein NR(II) [Gammaproteobacteria bacterium]